MERRPMITIYTQVYNTKPFLAKCVESVLRQTFTDFEYVLIDNGSTDGCKEILERYAAQDSRIHLIQLEKNNGGFPLFQIVFETATGKYFAFLDSDDWLGPTFLEQMVSLAEHNHLDIVCTGTAFHMEGQKNTPPGVRSIPQQLIIEKEKYAAYFPYYHGFFRTGWGKLIRRDVFAKADLSIIDREGITNGTDTLFSFACLRQAKRICIDNSVLHHYLVRNKSTSHTYLPSRFKSNTILHQDAIDFLSQYGSVSKQNLHFLHLVYANAVYDTLGVLWLSSLSPAEKLQEYCNIAAHPTTVEAYGDTDEAIDRSRSTLIKQFLTISANVPEVPENFFQALQTLFPRCHNMLAKGVLPLVLRESALMAALCQDDPDKLAEGLLNLIQAKRYTKQYDLGGMLQALAQDKPLLRGISNTGFMRKYHEIYWMVWQGQTLEALDVMTGLLLENRVRSAEEEFLQLYLSIAALLEQVPAFLFGKMELARICLRQRRAEDCNAILSELEVMGVEDNEELADIRRQLASLGGTQ